MPTAVVGERACKLQGDFITTPGWIRHDHGYTGAVKVNKPVVWLDGLAGWSVYAHAEIFKTDFIENGTAASQTVTKSKGINLHKYGANTLPIRHQATFDQTSPSFS